VTADQRIVLAAVCLTSIVLPLDFAGAAVAAPAIARELSGGAVAVAWIVNAFMLSLGASVMAAGALADACGRKRVFVGGAAVFALTSLGVATAPSLVVLDVERAVQGVGGAAMLASGTAILAQALAGPARLRAFSLLGTTFGAGLAFGPSLGGLLLRAAGWRAVFVPGIAVAVLALVVATPRIRESRDPAARGLDVPGTVAFTAALSLFTCGLLEAPARGWTDRVVLALFGGALALAAAFVAIERRVARPMLDLSLFRYPRFLGVQALPVGTACCYVVLLILLPTRFVGIEGRGEAASGALMLALSAPMLVIPFAAAVAARWLAPGLIAALGLVLSAIGLLWLGGVPPHAPAAVIVPPMVAIGCGAAMPWGLMDGLSVSVVPTERAGMAAGIFGTTRVAGEGVLLAAARAVLATVTTPRVAAGDLSRPGDAAVAAAKYGSGFHTLCVVLALATLTTAACVVFCVGTGAPKRNPAVNTA
jgi:MFS family permease